MARPAGFHGFLLAIVLLSGCFGGRSGGSRAEDEHHSSSDALRAEFAFQPSSPAAGTPVQFRDASEGNVTSRAWDFGDATGSTDRNPSHAYAAAGAYRVTLRVKDATGNQADVLHLVTVSPLARPGEDPNLTSAPAGPSFAKPVVVKTSNGGEPSLAIDAQGAYYVNPPGSLYKSSDGKSFSLVSYPHVISGDSHVVVDKESRIWISDLEGGGVGAGPAVVPVLGPSAVWTSTDGGGSWSHGSFAASVVPLNDRQWLAVTSGGTGYLRYAYCTVPLVIGCALGQSLLTKTTDAGLTWTPTTHTFEWTSYPFANREDGTLYVVQSTGPGISVAVSTDGAASFSEVTVAKRRTETGESFVNGAVDDAGNAYVAWSDADRGQTDVYMSYSTNRGQSWRGPFLVSSSVGTHIFPWIAAGADGKVVVAWYGSEAKGDPNTLDAKAQWFVNVAQSANAHDANPVFSQVRASPDTIHVGGICTKGTGCTGDRDLYDFFMVQVAPDGRAAVAYAADGATSTTQTLFVVQSGGPRSR